MSADQVRGSARLEAMSPDDLHASINSARASYRIERWWKYGQPAIDRIVAVINITDVDTAGGIIGNIARMHGPSYQVELGVFPYGVPAVDGLRVNINLDQAVR